MSAITTRGLAWVTLACSLLTATSATAAKTTVITKVDAHGEIQVDSLLIEGLAPTHEQTLVELLPRALPTTMSGAEVIEFARRVKNLALFDLVEIEPVGRALRVKLRRKTTIAPIVDLSTGKTFEDSKVTLGAVENDIDGRGTRLGARASYSERGLNFGIWLYEHPYRPKSWATEYEIYYAGSGFRFEGADAETKWHRNRVGGEIELLSPFLYGAPFRYEFQLNVYRETVTTAQGPNVPKDGVYVGTTSEFIWDQYTFNDLTPKGVRAAFEFRPGVFLGAVEPRHELRAKAIVGLPLGSQTVLMAFTQGAIVNEGNPNHSALLGSQQGVRGLADSLYRNYAQAYVNVELRHALSLGKRWYLQGVLFADGGVFEPMDARGNATSWQTALSTGAGIRILPTALVDTLLRVDVARLHEPRGAWLVQFGINQYF